MPARLVALALPLAFLFGGAHGFGYIQTVEVTETVALYAGEGNDVVDVISAEHKSTIDGGSGDDELAVKHAANNEIIGGDGNDEIYALELDYHKGFLDGGAGDDVIEIGRSGFKVTGDAGADTISMTVLDQIGDVQRPVAVTISERFWVGKQ
ncbi:hypothetical protein JL720_7882 [Aureococcus anophagefferens]|nr:hypothetical protein JL720_7882 [Aureococcus anophagefferens]